VYPGAEVPLFYDPMVAKLVVWGTSRGEAIRRLGRALIEYRVRGIATNIAFFRKVLADPDFINGQYHTGFLSPARMEKWAKEDMEAAFIGELTGGAGPLELEEVAAVAAALAAFERDSALQRTSSEAGTSNPWRWSLR
jgi:acetyl-CoA carboxylase biotin carboxylase subunit